MTESLDKATVSEIAGNILDTGSQMSKLITNLLDFTRTRLGQSLPINKEETDLALICRRRLRNLQRHTLSG